MKDVYPLAEKQADRLKTPSGLPFAKITLKAVVEGRVGMEDLCVTAEALECQARIAEAENRRQLAENFRRAAELVRVPEGKILEIYEALRPGRRSPEALRELARELEQEYLAVRCANLVREAAEAYASKNQTK